jgi:peroxiredoxin (alkyl hydroperoxide reductase subunit C)
VVIYLRVMTAMRAIAFCFLKYPPEYVQLHLSIEKIFRLTNVNSQYQELLMSLPRINEAAPDFNANTTHGPRSLADYKGKWLILFSHPADFTPVCTTEFMGFAKKADLFKSMNCELLGLSIDSIYSHLAWMQSIKNNFGMEIPFPIIDDIKMDVAQAYGMIHPGAADTQAVRATFFIDPEGKMRAMVYYPMSNGRSIDEFVRLLQAMQTSDANKIATPEGWTPGCDVIVPPPKSPEAIAQRLTEGYAMKDWYFATKSL